MDAWFCSLERFSWEGVWLVLTCPHWLGLRKTVWVVPCGHRTCDLVSLELSTNPGNVDTNPSINKSNLNGEYWRAEGTQFAFLPCLLGHSCQWWQCQGRWLTGFLDCQQTSRQHFVTHMQAVLNPGNSYLSYSQIIFVSLYIISLTCLHNIFIFHMWAVLSSLLSEFIMIVDWGTFQNLAGFLTYHLFISCTSIIFSPIGIDQFPILHEVNRVLLCCVECVNSFLIRFTQQF